YQTFTLTVVGPIGTITEQTPTIAWAAIPGASLYALRVFDTTGGGNNPVLNLTNLGSNIIKLSTAQTLTPGRSYSWAYVVVPTTRIFGTAHESFTIALPARPSAAGPAGGIATIHPTFPWTSVNGADHYDLLPDDFTADDIQVLHTTGNGTSLTLNASQAL